MTGPAAPVRTLPSTSEGGAHPLPTRKAPKGRGSITKSPPRRWTALGPETWLGLCMVAVVALLIVPLPKAILDILLALSLAASMAVLLVTLFTANPLEFSVFPSMLLLITLFRLGLNVSSTRLILGEGDAGRVIAAFGDATIGGNYVVGLVIFLILVAINFMVITKGAGRIAEVAARFTLDAMPGRQMSIDADLNAGIIDEEEARLRRKEISQFADFYGAMDGAAKFVRGEAITGLLIVAINLVGGFVIGLTQQGMSAGQALQTYTMLTVGDGLVTQIPALVVSTAAGLIVTYGATTPSVGPAIAEQFTRYARAMWIVSGVLLALALAPGFPAVPFMLLSGATGAVAWYARSREQARGATKVTEEQDKKSVPTAESQVELHELLHVDPLELEVGYALVPLVDETQKGDLLQRINVMRKQVAVELGMIVPPVRIRDNIQLPATEYTIKVRGVRVVRGEVMPQYLLALNLGGDAESIDGIRTRDPSFGMPAVWIQPDHRIEAESAGYTVVEPQTVLSTHLLETIKRHAGELLGRQDVQELLDALKESTPALVDDLIPSKLTLGTVHRVLQRLLNEGIGIRDLSFILEALADASEQTKDPDQLTEQVRRTLAPAITQLYEGSDGAIEGITIGPQLEAKLMALFHSSSGPRIPAPLEPAEITAVLTELTRLVAVHSQDGRQRPLITPPALRLDVRRLVEPILPRLPIVSLAELPPQTPIQSLATWELSHAA